MRYPEELTERLTLLNGSQVLVRPIRPEDEEAHQEFFGRLNERDVYFRFFGFIKGLSHDEMMRYTQIDYDHEMAFIAIGETGEFSGRTLGVVRAVGDSDRNEAEFAIVVRSDLKGTGIGYALLHKIIRYARTRGWAALHGQVMAENGPMLALAYEAGFERVGTAESGVVQLRLDLNERRECT